MLADGQVLEVGREPLGEDRADPQSRRGRLVDALADLLAPRGQLIREHQPQSLVNRSGYHLVDVLGDGHLDLARLLVGLRRHAGADHRSDRGHAAAAQASRRGAVVVRSAGERGQGGDGDSAAGPSACDLMDRRHLSLARESTVQYDLLIPPETEAVLLVEQEGDTLAAVRDRLAQVVDRVRRKKRLAFHAVQAQDRDEIELYWRLARKVVPTLYRMKGSTRPLPFIEDLAVPPEALGRFSGADAKRAQAAPGDRVAVWPCRPRAVAPAAVSRSVESGRRDADGPAGRRSCTAR